MQIVTLTNQKNGLEKKLEIIQDDQRLLKIDLASRKELCDKLDIEKDKINAELNEINQIRKKVRIRFKLGEGLF